MSADCNASAVGFHPSCFHQPWRRVFVRTRLQLSRCGFVRARLQPCRRPHTIRAASAAEVRFSNCRTEASVRAPFPTSRIHPLTSRTVGTGSRLTRPPFSECGGSMRASHSGCLCGTPLSSRASHRAVTAMVSSDCDLALQGKWIETSCHPEEGLRRRRISPWTFEAPALHTSTPFFPTSNLYPPTSRTS